MSLVQDVMQFVLSGPGWVIAGACLLLAFGLVYRNFRLQDERIIFEAVAKQANDGLVLQSADSTILWCNDAYCRIMGRPKEFWIGRKPQKWVFPPELCPSDEDIENFRFDPNDVNQMTQFAVQPNVRADGSRFWNQISVSPMTIGKKCRFLLICRDVTEQVEREQALKRAKEELQQAVDYDALTKLANRRKLTEHLDACLEREQETDGHVAVIHLDMDRFKEINDTHGHAAGDAVLCEVAKILKAELGENDLASRVGGDEFIYVMADVTSLRDVFALARRLLKKMSEPIQWNEAHLSFGASLGIALSDHDVCDGHDLIQRADFALYDVKLNGRGRFAVYGRKLRAQHAARRGLAEELGNAIDNDALDFFYQPIVDLKAMRVSGIETLVRWRHPNRGLISPIDFLPLAEEFGLLEKLDLNAMMAALRTLSDLSEAGHDDIYVGFNASSQILDGKSMLTSLCVAADALNVRRDLVVVEVLESVFLGEGSKESGIGKTIRHLSEAGFKTRLDDFGTGHAGLTHLAQLNVDGIKIDQSLISIMLQDETSDVIVRAILNLANELDLHVVSEGVENREVCRRLMEYGCKSIQGFGIAKPMPKSDLFDWLEQYNPHDLLIGSDVSDRVVPMKKRAT